MVYLATISWAPVLCQALDYVLVFQRLIRDRVYVLESHVNEGGFQFYMQTHSHTQKKQSVLVQHLKYILSPG